ncbi:MAG: hypothetical protein HYU66_13510 [Armatimonadetes bacterium]|nr:hypothetical protein [Armatimonadota bacterium]
MSGHSSAGTLRAGVARSEITTDAADAQIHDPLHATALVLDDGQTQAVIIAMDVVAIGGIGEVSDDFLPRLRGRFETELGLPGSHVLVNASHTHPPGRTLCDDSEQVERTFDAVRRAMLDMVPVTAGSGIGHEDRFAINRTLRLRNGKSWTIRHANPCPPDADVSELAPIDPDIGVLRFDRLDGSPLAVIFNYACHPLLGVPGGRITANYPGLAARLIEEQLGGGAMALFLQGCGGDVCEVSYKDVHRPRDARPAGVLLGLSTLRALSEIETSDATLSVVNQPLALPRRADSDERIAALREEQAALLATLRHTSLNFKRFLPLYLQYALDPDHPADYAYRYLHGEATGNAELDSLDAENRANLDKYLANIRAMEVLARTQDEICTFQRHQAINRDSGDDKVQTEVLGIRIGDCVLVSSPAELLVEVGLNVKRASPYEHTFVSAYSNGYIHYGAPAADYDRGGYEVVECFLAPEWQALYEATANAVIRRL